MKPKKVTIEYVNDVGVRIRCTRSVTQQGLADILTFVNDRSDEYEGAAPEWEQDWVLGVQS